MDISNRTKQLIELFSLNKKVELTDSHLEIVPFNFTQTSYENEVNALQHQLSPTGFCTVTDDCINENKTFDYTVFTPHGKGLSDKAIILLHGLNERSWDKYLSWAEHLAQSTGRSVILFPIAFHMNRTPRKWCNPREILPWVNARREEVNNLPNSTFANVALSCRISRQPLRLYVSGLQSAYNILQLAEEIKNGDHPLFRRDTSINIFAYSIGAFLAQILLLSNPDGIFSDSRLFMFCGGSIFSKMNGSARDILDKEASDRMMSYYTNDFIKTPTLASNDKSIPLEQAFRMMILPEVMQEERESFFQSACNRIRAISLKNDIVIPTEGIIKAFGKTAGKILEELDFPFPYSHQTPFPCTPATDRASVDEAFTNVFGKASSFLC